MNRYSLLVRIEREIGGRTVRRGQTLFFSFSFSFSLCAEDSDAIPFLRETQSNVGFDPLTVL